MTPAPAADDAGPRASEWDAYWDSPRLAACLRDAQGNYGGVIGVRWRRWFRRLPTRARVLDLATGNGAIALLALEYSDRADLDWRITGTDAARIDPPAALPHLAEPLSRIDFQGETPAENLPFSDSAFDAVTGQYALEYTDLGSTIPEVARVLRPQGQLLFITHRHDSSVCAETVRQLELVERLRTLDLVNQVRKLLNEQPGSSGHAVTRQSFDSRASRAMRILGECDGQGRIFMSQFLQQLGEIYQVRDEAGAEATLEALTELERDLQAHRERLRALNSSALTPGRIRKTCRVMKESGFHEVRTETLVEPDAPAPLGQCFEGVLGADAK